jgi:hypothetical protein
VIVLDATPVILRARGAPVYFVSPDETIEYARLHDIERWIVFGDPDGWWPLYTQAGPVNPAPEAKGRVDITLRPWLSFWRAGRIGSLAFRHEHRDVRHEGSVPEDGPSAHM